MENSPLFNASIGAVMTNEGKHELDASIMDGKTLNAGAVASVTTIKNPINAARRVMDSSVHVMLIGHGAELFAEQQGLELVENNYFTTKRRLKQLKKAKGDKTVQLDHVEDAETYKFGTVGAVALDSEGNIAAGTSTGGMTNKKYGRVGDSPIIGAGTYANNKTCGVSGTGHGEYYIRNVVCYDISALMEYKKMSLKEAANLVVNEKLKSQNGSGGVVALDYNGNVAMPFNTKGMYRGYITLNGDPKVYLYK
jgi:beta-aspartyl-peptidase (threonine type)